MRRQLLVTMNFDTVGKHKVWVSGRVRITFELVLGLGLVLGVAYKMRRMYHMHNVMCIILAVSNTSSNNDGNNEFLVLIQQST